MQIRFQADADFNQIILAAVVRRVPELDFRTASAGGLARLTDLDVLALCARDGRLLVTHDQSTMPRHFAEFVTTSSSPGVIVVPQTLSVSSAAEDLILVWTASEPKEWRNRIAFLPL